jgi:biotin transport system substrate-specific component
MTHPSFPLSRDRRLVVVGVVGFALAVAAAAQIAVPLPGTPVPLTLQPLAVVLAGLWLGPVAGAASMVLYIVAGAAGLPVFAPMGAPGVLRLLGPTGGYIWAYPVAALLAGLVGRELPSLPGRVLAAALGIASIHAGGVAQLAVLTGSVERAAALGTFPFLLSDLVKAFLAGLLSPSRSDRAQS